MYVDAFIHTCEFIYWRWGTVFVIGRDVDVINIQLNIIPSLVDILDLCPRKQNAFECFWNSTCVHSFQT
jgi:hypothetical protein